jgi:transcriptional regulator with XRE-family HTH domain
MMNAKEAVVARQSLGLTQDATAAEFNLTPGVVAAWESGEIRVPKRIEEQFRWRIAAKERIDALAASGLPECEWRKSWETRPAPSDLKALTKYYEEGIAHAKTCQICAARENYIKDRFGEMPPTPAEGWMKIFGFVAAPIERFPRWAQPAGWMAVAFGVYSLLRIVLMLPALARNPQYWPVALGGLALSVSIGAAVGLLYGGFRELRNKRVARRAT